LVRFKAKTKSPGLGELIMVQPPAWNPVSWHGMTILLLGAIIGMVLWTPALPWLFKSLGFD
jgi:hypothetical protein